jgi:hypothetical protein
MDPPDLDRPFRGYQRLVDVAIRFTLLFSGRIYRAKRDWPGNFADKHHLKNQELR